LFRTFVAVERNTVRGSHYFGLTGHASDIVRCKVWFSLITFW
jgi:hypothetical protein